MTEERIISDVFTTTSGQYFSMVLSLWLRRYWWLPFVPVVILGALGISLDDWRFILVALMLVFIIIPMGMSFLYTYYLLTPEARRSIRPKSVEIEPGVAITLVYEPEKQPEEDKNDGPKPAPLPERERIEREKIKEVKFTSSNIVYILDTPRLQFIMVPYSVFASCEMPFNQLAAAIKN
ncbi:MAG: hypothetical protein NC039_07230 [Muribaculaceae bacterium]|nr:hypothetical protein [Muribaculaceae bacterium]